MISPLVYVRTSRVVDVPPVCTVFWTAADWARQERRIVEPLVLDALGYVWTATGERDAAGKLLYRTTRQYVETLYLPSARPGEYVPVRVIRLHPAEGATS